VWWQGGVGLLRGGEPAVWRVAGAEGSGEGREVVLLLEVLLAEQGVGLEEEVAG